MKRYQTALIALILTFFVSCSKDTADPTPTPTPAPVITYTISISAGEGGTVSTSGGTFEKGSSLDVTATALEGFIFEKWSDETTSNPKTILVDQDKSLTAYFIPLVVPFASKSERYSAINETTGFYQLQSNFLRYLTEEEQRELDLVIDECIRYWASPVEHLTYDFNGDGFLDLFGFMYYSNCTDGYYGHKPGKYFLIDDYFNGGETTYYFDASFSWGGRFEFGDVDNDGQPEVIVYPNNRHEYYRDSSLLAMDVLVVDISPNFELTETQLGYTPYDLHNGAVGDVDNDGDIDLIKIKIGQWDQNENQFFPKTLLNQGGLVFNEIELLTNQADLESEFFGFNSTMYELFDLNEDGNLDLITGLDIGKIGPVTEGENIAVDQYYGEILVLWGDGTGTYSTENMTIVEDSNYLNDFQILLGTCFTDYDNDGDIDVITSSTQEYKGFALNLFRNNGDQTFTDVTTDVFDISHDYGDFFWEFYRVYSIDVDGDGDFDLVPGDSHFWDYSKSNIDNLYWENSQGEYLIHKDN